ncbi:hypothetical protein ATO10_10790 [Actibacterium atlanticum]|uniref:DUF3306 domain-containing protein n=1 Tax=Actibacterium atlanticum TaxID=1461693 RepID=A0A058ZKV7_9RHOB|nr:DUF3306 domain-containing protein [Actibacterium atlanticum]KCV81827.1 hypothetical protein ATO10_10790 [Actibacterium atlanticum]
MSNDFWSRRKAAVQAEQQDELRAEEALAEAEREAALADKPDAEILEELGLPDPDTLGEGDDFKAFLAKTVPARIRQRAIRRLWLSNPVLANVDGLVDYGEDYTDSNLVIEGLKTAYQVGKGMTRHIEEMARQAEAERLAHEAQTTADHDPDAAEGSAEGPEEIAGAEESPNPAAVAVPTPQIAKLDAEDTADDPIPDFDATRRRMRFVFDASQAPA